MDEYIKREEAINAVRHAWAKGLEPTQYIEAIPAADVVEVVHGRWEDTGIDELDLIYGGWKCSACGYIFCGNKTNFCPDCGAKMEG